MDITRTLGAHLYRDGRCVFRVWAPFAENIRLEIFPIQDGSSYSLDMVPQNNGYYELTVENIQEGDKYFYCFAGHRFPDPAADFQPEGINGPSGIIMRELAPIYTPIHHLDYVIYELHVGTYTEAGTFTAIIPHLAELKDLGITALELMPIAQFSGGRNWGYDGVFPFAVQDTYGGPSGLKSLVHACHQQGISVILDVVYNHLGPEGNCLGNYGPYFSTHYKTPWGPAINVDDAYSDPVRQYFIENALHWFVEYGIDALRLDAVHAINDMSAYPFLEELGDNVRALIQKDHRPYSIFVENDERDVRHIRSKTHYGFGLNAMWNNDFQYALEAVLMQEKNGIYQDFGSLEQFAKAYQQGFVYAGDYSVFHKKTLGHPDAKVDTDKLVVFLQNHDQIGNRICGERLTTRLSSAQIKLAAGLLLCSPSIPLLFMGEEYGETAPFQYFISHQDERLIEAVREGRCYGLGVDGANAPDPQAVQTFLHSKLDHTKKETQISQQMFAYYKQLLAIRKKYFNLRAFKSEQIHVEILSGHQLGRVDHSSFQARRDLNSQQTLLKLTISHDKNTQQLVILANFSDALCHVAEYLPVDKYQVLISSFSVSELNISPSALPPYGFLLLIKGGHHAE